MTSESAGAPAPLPPPEPVTDAQALCARVSGEQRLDYLEIGMLEAAAAVLARWPGLAQLHAVPGRAASGAPVSPQVRRG